jgi:SAM-dependent methyltransferase
MHEILQSLPVGAVVLDLGCRSGSFVPSNGFSTIRLDIERPQVTVGVMGVQADAARIPFRDRTFDAVISNHSLEHIEALEEALQEIGRVLRPSGALYVAVPDATTVTDRLYRWMARGGGHVNGFNSVTQVAALIERTVRLPFVGGHTLFSSLSFLHRRSRPARTSRKIWLFFNGTEWCLRVVTAALRLLDITLGTRTSVYGWALYFGTIKAPIQERSWSNVCVGCGSGYDDEWLLAFDCVKRGLLWRTFSCPACGSRSPFFPQRLFRNTIVQMPGAPRRRTRAVGS